MSVYEPNSRHLREVLIFCFNMKKSAAEAHQCSQILMVRSLLVKERVVSGFNASRTVILTSKTGSGGREKVFEDAELGALLEQDCQNQEELARSLGVTQQAISKRLKTMGIIQK